MLTTKSNKDLNLEEDLNLFDEDDWDFLHGSGESVVKFDYFDDVRDSEFKYKEPSKLKFALFVVGFSVLSVIGVYGGVHLYKATIGRDFSTNQDVINSQTEIDNSALKYVEGDEVDSETLITISQVFNQYFSVLSSQKNYSSLHSYCLSNSAFATLEENYRNSIAYSYDTNDCYSRALREFGRFIKLNRVNSIILKDDTYYCYLELEVPDIDNFYEYYAIYDYELTKYFSVNTLDSINVTKYMLGITSHNDLPLKQSEYLFIVKKVDDNYILIDDSQITSLCTEYYSSSINQIVSILGGKLATNQHK